MEAMDYWRLCDELSIIQAALLIVGEDPGPLQDCIEGWPAEQRPIGYEAAKAALLAALKNKTIEGKGVCLPEFDYNGNHTGWIEGSVDMKASCVLVSSLCSFLENRGYKVGFFVPRKQNLPDYLDPNNPHYAPKLAAAVGAWTSVSSEPTSFEGKSPKRALDIWLRKNADKFGLTKDDGNPNEQGIDEISKIANWNPKGGAPKTPTGKKIKK